MVAGETFKVSLERPGQPRAISSPSCPRARARARTAARISTPRRRTTPAASWRRSSAGEYELRYSTAEKYLTLARAAITVTPAKNEPGKVAVTLAAGDESGGAIEIILDASGSMLQKLGTERRIDIAKRTLTKLIASTIPAGTPFAFRVFGREVDSCQTDLDVPVAPLNPAAVGAAHRRAGRQERRQDAHRRIARQGGGRSQERHGREAHRAGHRRRGNLRRRSRPRRSTACARPASTTRVSIVGFALDDEKLAATFRRWSDAGGGAFFDAKDAAGLDKSLTEALRPGFEVVNAQGQVLASGSPAATPSRCPRAITPCASRGARMPPSR